MDFERSLQPPPQPTEESTASLEDLIKRRIANHQFDDPQRKAPPPDDLQKELAELDDKKSAKVRRTVRRWRSERMLPSSTEEL